MRNYYFTLEYKILSKFKLQTFIKNIYSIKVNFLLKSRNKLTKEPYITFPNTKSFINFKVQNYLKVLAILLNFMKI